MYFQQPKEDAKKAMTLIFTHFIFLFLQNPEHIKLLNKLN